MNTQFTVFLICIYIFLWGTKESDIFAKKLIYLITSALKMVLQDILGNNNKLDSQWSLLVSDFGLPVTETMKQVKF